MQAGSVNAAGPNRLSDLGQLIRPCAKLPQLPDQVLHFAGVLARY
jgi:hypothetical protein